MADLTSGYSHFERPADTDWSEHGAVGDVATGRRFKKIQKVPMKTVVDEASETVTYVGYTKPGTATSEALWRIMRISVSGAITSVEFANGADLFDRVWDLRSEYTYS